MGRKPKTPREKAEEREHLERLGNHLKELREAKKLTPQDLADKLGVTPQYIYMIENGRAKPSEERLNELARALGNGADEFLTTALEHVEEEFAARLKAAGLSPKEIEQAAQRVSARVKEDVISGKESLRVSRGQAPEKEIWGAIESGEDILAMESPRPHLEEPSSAAQYAKAVKGRFVARSSPRTPYGATAARQARGGRGQTIEAGPAARIVVDRMLTRKERNVLQDIGKVIDHLLNNKESGS